MSDCSYTRARREVASWLAHRELFGRAHPLQLRGRCRNEAHRLKAEFAGKYFLNEHGGRQWPPRYLDLVNEPVFIQMQVLVAFYRDSVAGETEEDGDVSLRSEPQVHI